MSAGVDAGVRLGLGKQAEDDHYTAAENISRKRLEVELQADETSERKERREVGRAGQGTGQGFEHRGHPWGGLW